MANVKLGDKIYEGVEKIKLQNPYGGEALFSYAGGNLSSEGGVLSSFGDAMYSATMLKLCDEVIPVTQIGAVHVDVWRWKREGFTEEELEAIRTTPCGFGWMDHKTGYDEIVFECPPGSGEYAGVLMAVNADGVERYDAQLTRGTYWYNMACYPTGIVVAPKGS